MAAVTATAVTAAITVTERSATDLAGSSPITAATASRRTVARAKARPRPAGRRARASGPDRLTVLLLTVAAFLGVLALLSSELLSADRAPARRPVIVLRRVHETRVVETVRGSSAASGGGTSVTQSVSSSGSAAVPAAAATRSS